MAEQLTFDLASRPSLSRGDFFVSDANQLALARLDGWETWTNGKLVLVGPTGAGKTHLAHVWAETLGAEIIAGPEVGGFDVGGLRSAVVVDDADHVAVEDEATLFHLHNHAAAEGRPLLLTGKTAPSRWDITLPDLKSRMEAAELARIDAPDDDLLAAVIMKLFADRQTGVSPATIAWLTRHVDRSFSEAQRIVSELDARALAEGRAVTRDLAQEVLENRP